MPDFKNTERLHPQAKDLIIPYLQKLLNILSDNIISVNIYGSAISGDYVPGKSDINVLVVLREVGLGDLKKSLKLVSEGIRKKITAPLFLTKRHIETSLDVFPVEFLDLKGNHLLVYGEDVLSGLVVEDKNLRFTCEQQLKGKLIRLRQAYLEVGLKKKGIEALLKESFKSLIPIFRNCLRLKGITPHVEKEEALVQLQEAFGIDSACLLAILKDKQEDEKIAGKDVEVYLEKFMEQVKILAQAIDAL